MSEKPWIFISTHFDDVILSCGALVWDLVHHGDSVQVWTIMGGYPPDEVFSPFADFLHHNWGKAGREAIDMRREEDRAACATLGALHRHFDWPDAIYRHDPQTGAYTVNDSAELFGRPVEDNIVDDVATGLAEALPGEAHVILPIGLGGHVDHRTVVEAGKKLEGAGPYYADYPYILTDFENAILSNDIYQPIPHTLGSDALQAWQDAVLCYQSQVGDFWRDETETRLALRNYFAGGGGRLWQKKTPV